MSMTLLASLQSLFRSAPRAKKPVHLVAARRFRPVLEGLEERTVMSSPGSLAPPVLGQALVAPAFQQASSILPITINNVINTASGLVANASLLGQAFQIPLTLEVPVGQLAASPTQILNLHLGPIHLDVLGLKVDTSEICLNISAQPGSGNLLGNLLGGIAHSLDQGLPLGQILGNLGNDLNTVTTGLTGLLNGAFGALTTPANAASGAAVSSAGTTRILHLAVGPLHLNLLGLEVNLDNCHNGPITVDITAQTGPGNLLGNLLGGLSHLLDSNANQRALLNKLAHIAREIASLV